MENNDMIQILMKKIGVSFEEASEALESNNWDLLDAVIYLERKNKIESNDPITIIEVKEESQERQNSNKKEDRHGGIGEVLGRIFKFIGKIIRKGNDNYLDISKDNEKPIRISLTVLVLLAIFLSIPTVAILIIGLFCGYKYSIVGPNTNYQGVNNIFEEVSKSANNIKKDFKEGYENK